MEVRGSQDTRESKETHSFTANLIRASQQLVRNMFFAIWYGDFRKKTVRHLKLILKRAESNSGSSIAEREKELQACWGEFIKVLNSEEVVAKFDSGLRESLMNLVPDSNATPHESERRIEMALDALRAEPFN